MIKDIIKEIIAKKKERIAQSKIELPQGDLLARIENLPLPLRFFKAIDRPRRISLIAEIKKASPSRGVIREDFDPCQIARIYREAGVQAISVLTEEDYFLGDINYISQVKQIANLPILRKDFIVDPYQIYQSRAFGADAVLLIAAILTQDALVELMDLAKSLNLDYLVEVHTEKDLRKALNVKAELIGINNRNLHTLEVDSKTTEKLYTMIPKEKAVVVESGIKSYSDILFLKILGAKAALVGEAIMAAADIEIKIKEIMGW
ncbi:MAG: indole-3-glycerol phosphate synthase TrpC [Candidatus Omnitrophota bacterium]